MIIVETTLFWGLDNNISRILSQRIDITRIIQLKSFIGGFILLALGVLLGIVNINLMEIPYILLLGIVGFAASLYFFLGLSKIGTTNTMLILSLSSVFGLVLAVIILQEHISTFQIIATGIMVFGMYLISQNNIRYAKITVQS